jgi:hypothetical protein
MKYHLLWSLLAFGLLGSGCSHMSYSRASETESIKPNDNSNTLANGYDLEHQTNEIALLDRSGIVCGSLTTNLEATGNAMSAEREAIREGKTSYTYQYRQHSPAEYSGLECGGYYRWGGGEGNRLNIAPAANLQTEYPIDSEVGEGGLHVGFTEFMFDQAWLRYGFDFRLGMGRFTFIHDYPNTAFPETLLDNDDSEWFFRMPFVYTQKVYPWFLFGFGVEGFLGVDPIMLAFSGQWSNILDYIDYGGRAGYAYTFEYGAVGAYFGYAQRNIAWGDYIAQADVWKGTLSIDINYDAF